MKNLKFSLKYVLLIMAGIAFLSCSIEEDFDNATIEEPINLQFNLEKNKTRYPIGRNMKSGKRGFVYDAKSWKKLAGVKIVFKEIGRHPQQYTVSSDKYGYFDIELKPGKYFMYAGRYGYETYVTSPGYSVVTIGKMGTLNIFLKKMANVATAEKIELVSGNNQSATINTALTNAVIVRVLDQFGNPFPNHDVNIISHDGSVSSGALTTNANGLTSINWTLGENVGEQRISALSYKADGTTPLTGSILAITATAL